ncbi:MAG TPA: hypothetical protein VF575_03040 [Candidatus Saccharimonadales bacterium]|jgi:hypothetical protein
MATDEKDTNTQQDAPAVIETDSLETPSEGGVQPAPGQQQAPVIPKQPNGLKKFGHKFNIYLLLFVLVIIISGAIVIITATSQKTDDDTAKISSQAIPSDVLKQLAKSDATVGDPKQVLNVQSNAVFTGKVLIRDSLDVAGALRVNGGLSIPDIAVSGQGSFDQLQINKTLNVGGDTSVLGQLNVKKGMSVTGGGTFGGPVTAPQIATNQLQLIGDLTISNHFIAGGPTPGRSNGGALGGGGTTSVSGTDTAGSININTGGGPAGGCFLTVNFSNRYNSTPHVVITPTSPAGAALDYYVTRTTSGFSVCAASTPPANSSFGYDYIVVG